jgi:hypothetical protein
MWCRVFGLISCFVLVCLGDVADDFPLPENTPVSKFFKYSFTRLDEGDARSLAMVMKDAYLNLCKTLHGCREAEFGLEDLYQRRHTELQINVNKMRKLGSLLQRLVAAGRPPEDEHH